MRLVILMSLILSSACLFAAEKKRIVVVTHKSSPLKSLTKEEVRDLYLGRLQKIEGQMIRPVDLPSYHPSTQRFRSEAVGKDQAAWASYWGKRVYGGVAVPPLALESTEDVSDWLGLRPNLVGYLPIDAVTADMKILYELDE